MSDRFMTGTKLMLNLSAHAALFFILSYSSFIFISQVTLSVLLIIIKSLAQISWPGIIIILFFCYRFNG